MLRTKVQKRWSDLKYNSLTFVRSHSFQPIWEKLHHLSILGMNHWASRVDLTGEMDVLRFDCRLKGNESLIVVDVGANEGQFALQAQKILQPCTTHSIEPSLYTFNLLVNNIRLSDRTDRMHSYRLGLSDKAGTTTLYSSHEGATVASVYNLRNPYSEFKPEFSEAINLHTLDEFSRENEIHHIHYLKIDVEGHELSVLKGATELLSSCRIDFIQFEFGAANIDFRTYMRDFFDLLSDDYDLFRIVPHGPRPLGAYSSEHEVFATINYLAALKDGPAIP